MKPAQIILASRENQFVAPQAVLIGRGGRRYRTLLHRARIQGDGTYCCEFLAIEEVGGPLTGLPIQQLSLLTAIRMGYRFRSEVIQKFPSDFDIQSSGGAAAAHPADSAHPSKTSRWNREHAATSAQKTFWQPSTMTKANGWPSCSTTGRC